MNNRCDSVKIYCSSEDCQGCEHLEWAKRITALEAELAALRAKLPGPFDVVVTVPEATIVDSGAAVCRCGCPFRWTDKDGMHCGVNFAVIDRPIVGLNQPGPGCPRYKGDK